METSFYKYILGKLVQQRKMRKRKIPKVIVAYSCRKWNFARIYTEICCNELANSLTKHNPLDFKDNYSATSNNTKVVHWPLMGELLHLVQREGGLDGLLPRPVPSSLYEM